jgi:hypothetical protein
MYYSHNLHFVSYARMYQGRYDDSIDYARRLRKNVDGAIDDMPMLAPYGAFIWMVQTTFVTNSERAGAEGEEQLPPCDVSIRARGRLCRQRKGEGSRSRAGATRRDRCEIPETETLMINPART